MKLNCDLGESFGSWSMGQDEHVMPCIDQANIACGFHAGDPIVMQRTIALAVAHQVAIGAHPSYPDLSGFGRRTMALSDNELRQTLHYQMAALHGMAAVQGTTITYVKTHGALYNDMMANEKIRTVIMQAVADYPLDIPLMLQATPAHEQHRLEAEPFGLPLLFEAFADRCYTDEGALVSRREAHAVLSEAAMMAQVKSLTQHQQVTTENGHTLRFPVDSLCVHGDNEQGVAQIKTIREWVDAGNL